MVDDPVKKYLAAIGRKGGQAKVAKGFASLTSEERRAMSQRAAAKRWKKKTGEKRAAAKRQKSQK
jgi:hypothetical protein